MAEYIRVPAGRIRHGDPLHGSRSSPDHVAIRYVAEDGKTVVEKKYREYAQDIRRNDGLSQGRSAGHQGPAHRSAEPELL